VEDLAVGRTEDVVVPPAGLRGGRCEEHEPDRHGGNQELPCTQTVPHTGTIPRL
jgi:hypothetical protein